MKREEEIRQEMSKIAGTHPDWSKNDCMRMGFREGARWADGTMIDRVCKWLENNVNNYIIIDDYLGKVQLKISSIMFDDLKKIMEG